MAENREKQQTEFAAHAGLLAEAGKLAISFDHHHAGTHIGQKHFIVNFFKKYSATF